MRERLSVARAARCTGTEKAMLLLIAAEHDDEPIGRGDLAHELCVSPRQVQRAANALVEAGHLTREAAGRETIYRVVIR